MCPPTDTSLTLTNLTQLLEDVKNWDFLGYRLDIPKSVRAKIRGKKSSESQCKKACWKWYLDNRPSPSWKRIAVGLYLADEHELLEVLKSQYFKCRSHVQCMINGISKTDPRIKLMTNPKSKNCV